MEDIPAQEEQPDMIVETDPNTAIDAQQGVQNLPFQEVSIAPQSTPVENAVQEEVNSAPSSSSSASAVNLTVPIAAQAPQAQQEQQDQTRRVEEDDDEDDEVDSEDEGEEEERIVDRFESLFTNVARPGDFAVGSVLSSDFAVPAITVNGIPSMIGLPLVESQAKEIIAVASKSPFGRREETLFDDNVRNSWQLDPSQFKINNTKWNNHVKQLLDTGVRPGLGITNLQIGCSLYKLLLYEKGGHFKFHRDTEKEDGMFGTLIIQLPSLYEGGQITIRHRRSEHTFDFAKDAAFTPYFAAFYADCEHQIQTVTSGYRLCLIYNLVYRGPGEAPRVHDQSVIYNNLMRLHREWIDKPVAPSNLIYILEHKYSKSGLTFSNMKGLDAAILQLLNKANTEGKFNVYLAILTKVEMGAADYHREFMDDAETSVELSNWITPDNRMASLPKYSIDPDEQVFPFDRYEDLEMKKEEFEEATGNEGATLERWYQTAVIVFWPVERSNNLWLDMGTNLAVQKLGSMISDVVDRNQMIQFANRLITKWDYNGIIVPMIENINELRDTQLAIRFCNEVLIKKSSTYSSGVGRAIKSLITVFGWNTMQEYVAQYIRRLATAGYDGMENGVKFIGELAPTTIGSTIQPSDYFICNNLVDSIWTQYCSRVSSSYYYSRSSDHETIGMLLVYLYRLNMQDKISTIITYILQNTERYKSVAFVSPLVKKLVTSIGIPYFKALGTSHPFYIALDTCIARINNDIREAIRPPTDWNLKVTGYNCHDPRCASCTKVKAFLNNPSLREFSVRANQSERTHVERLVRSHTKDIKFETLRVGTPHTLKMSKEWNSYRESVDSRKKDVSELKQLQDIRTAILQSDATPAQPVKKEEDVIVID